MKDRLCKLQEAAIGQSETITHSPPLSLAYFECSMDVLTALYDECTGSSSLSRDKTSTNLLISVSINICCYNYTVRRILYCYV